ncbi:hypothetical protein CEUSTIGMA_g11921.t1 [Chlamydomonas eustigma]|uniref:Uncharacterized protein n=1 Tax=Chlamydomonas eustigma TaxID=1157962 RepID=A0A250XN39_9CHLO|nr:hypothetical protein CEUSTIGMA_g11921.t1 [Chlamydomonas eustigma]|eukprot:GAX84501.1 hypothetical protein CEUSTIGMA_g11921.t1 [Chlamydomonas eustigma]
MRKSKTSEGLVPLLTGGGLLYVDERRVALEKLLKCASARHGVPALLRMSCDTGDRGSADVRTYSMAYDRIDHPERRARCGPDWCFVHWPSANIISYARVRDAIVEAGQQPAKLPGIVGWFGNVDTDASRSRLRSIASSRPDLFHVNHVPPTELATGGKGGGYVSMPTLVSRYGILIDLGGYGYSGRLKYLLFSRRPLLIVDRRARSGSSSTRRRLRESQRPPSGSRPATSRPNA